MRDPFRPNSNRQLVREAQVGFMVICALTSLLIYVAWFRLSGRFDQVPSDMLNAPVAQHVAPESWNQDFVQSTSQPPSSFTTTPLPDSTTSKKASGIGLVSADTNPPPADKPSQNKIHYLSGETVRQTSQEFVCAELFIHEQADHSTGRCTTQIGAPKENCFASSGN